MNIRNTIEREKNIGNAVFNVKADIFASILNFAILGNMKMLKYFFYDENTWI